MNGIPSINLTRYPIQDPSTVSYREAVVDAQARLAVHGALELPEFLTPESTRAMLDAVVALKPSAHYMERMLPAYSDALADGDDLTLPADHPARVRLPASHHAIAGDVIGRGSPLDALYRDPHLIRFVGDVLAVDPLFPLGDPLGGLNVLLYEPGDSNGWHFDSTSFVISLVLQSAESGGVYEYLPDIRSETDANLDAVSERMRFPDSGTTALTAKLTPGTLFLFRGRHTLHRVTTVYGDRSRVVAILSYHQSPNYNLSESTRIALYGRVV